MTDFKSLFDSVFGIKPENTPEPVVQGGDYRVIKSEVLKEIVHRGSVLVRVGDKHYRITSAQVEITR